MTTELSIFSPVSTHSVGIVSARALRPYLDVIAKSSRRQIKLQYRDLSIGVNGSARLSWTNGETYIVGDVPCDHEGEDFAIHCSAADLKRAVPSIKGSIRIDSARTVSVGPVSVNVPAECDPADQSPVRYFNLDLSAPSHAAEMSARDFRRGIKLGNTACDPTATRWALGGVLLISNAAGGLDFVATDSRRFLIAQSPARVVRMPGVEPAPNLRRTVREANPDFQAILPRAAGETLLKLIPDDDSLVTLQIDSAWIVIQWRGGELRTKRLDGMFPEFADIVPGLCSLGTSADLLVSDLLPVLESAVRAATEDSRGFDFFFRENLIVKSIRNVFHAEAPGVTDGVYVSVTLDPRFLLDLLKLLPKTSRVQFGFAGRKPEESPVRIDVDGLVYIVMPLTRDR